MDLVDTWLLSKRFKEEIDQTLKEMDTFLGCLSGQEQALLDRANALILSMDGDEATSLAVRGEIILINREIDQLQTRIFRAKHKFEENISIRDNDAAKVLSKWYECQSSDDESGAESDTGSSSGEE